MRTFLDALLLAVAAVFASHPFDTKENSDA